MEKNLYQRIRNEIGKIPLVDTHEHFMLEKERLNTRIDFFYLFPHYASSDLVSSGMSPKVLDEIWSSDLSLENKWDKFEPHWKNIKNTAYARSLLIAARDLFEVEDINKTTWRKLSEKIASSNREGWYRYVLKEKANIDVSIVDDLDLGSRKKEAPRIERSLARLSRIDRELPPMDPEFFLPVVRFDEFVIVRTLNEIRQMETMYHLAIHSLNDLLKTLDRAFEQRIKKRIIGVKTGLAYLRTLKYDKVTKHEAELLFNRIFHHMGEGLSWKEAKPLQDFMMHQIIRRTIEYNLPVQIHTGLQEGNGNIITNSNPTHLVNLFIEYKEAKFDLFHSGYPYTGELATLAKNFPNVYADMCWLHIVSPYIARRTLEEWIEMIPANKIFAFGGDYIIVEGAYAHSCLARDNVARVLTEKINEGYFTENEALELARKILRENPAAFFKIEEKHHL